MKAIAYIRWSDEHQSKGSSLARQTKDIEAFCAEMGWPIVERLKDDGQSAYKGHNLTKGALGDIERRTRKGELTGYVLVVERMDRLSRRVGFDALMWFGQMVELGLTIALVDKKMIVDAASIRNQRPQLRAILDDMDAAHDHSEKLSARVGAAWQTMRDGKPVIAEYDGTVTALTVVGELKDVTRVDVARANSKRADTYWLNGFEAPLQAGDSIQAGQTLGVIRQKVHTGNTCPAWLELTENRTAFAVRHDVVALIDEIFREYRDTDKGARGIAKWLNARKVPTLRDGKCWQGSAVKALIHNRGLIGEYEYRVRGEPNGVVVPDYFPPVLDLALWQAVNDKALGRIKSNHSRTSNLRHLLSDVGRCFECKSKLTFVSKRKRPDNRFDSYAVCQSAYLNTGCQSKGSLRMVPIEDAVLDNLLTLAMDDEHFADIDQLPDIRRELAEAKRELEEHSRRIEALLDLINDPTFQRDERFNLRLRTAQHEEKHARKAVEEAQERLKAAQGAVSPQEHVRRVSEIRADLWSTDEAKGYEARRKVKLAINDLVQTFYVSAADRQAVVVLKDGVRHLLFDWKGNLTHDGRVWRDHADDFDSQPVKDYFERMAKQPERQQRTPPALDYLARKAG